MPFINIAVAGKPLSAEQKRRLTQETTRLMADILRKRPEVTAVRIDEFPAENWAVGALPISGSPVTAVHMDVKITQGTNTEAEKASFLAAAMRMLKDAAGAVPEASYIVVDEIPAVNWGYGGLSQAERAARKVA